MSKKKKVGKFILFLNEKIGEGTYATVFKGQEQGTKAFVAVKVLDKKQIKKDQYTQNAFRTEINVMKTFNSPNIIKFLDVSETTNNYYIVQQYAEGGTLRKLLEKQKHIPENQAIDYMSQLLNGFTELIKYGVVHRDIKPQNILIKNGQLKICDFGFAKQFDVNNGLLKTYAGTPLYMSPQILQEQKYTYKCDIWALGVMFYEMLVGKSPWQLKYQNNMLKNIQVQKIQFPSNLNISKNVKQFILGCLQYDQQKRFGWQHVYSHPLFVNKFGNINIVHDKNSIQLGFVVSSLRNSIHSQNLDMDKLLSKLPNSFNAKEFKKLIQLLDNSLNQTQIKLLFDNVIKETNSNDTIPRQKINQYLVKHNVRMISVDPVVLNITVQEDQKIDVSMSPNYLLSRIRKKIYQKKLDIYEMYKKQDKSLSNALRIQQFSKLIDQIDNTFKNDQIKVIFNAIDQNNDGIIGFSQFYQTMCKLSGVLNDSTKQ